ncbi:pericentrin isoform X3 [Sminthopsis crassicaudata]|uniref:pericentrin isoform X3 n=1 Tax=Sminthopsis crassicaudata TaxID=9301 RepID=UPI003D69CCF6
MEDVERDERRRKVEAGRAKLAQFRQRKAKGDGAGPKKKAAKRKNAPVPAAVPEEEEERAVAGQSAAGEDGGEDGGEAPRAQGGGRSPLGVDPSVPEVPATQDEVKMPEEKLEGRRDAADLPGQQVAELPPWLAQCSEASQLQQELAMAVQERDRIIVQLSSNLQQARQSHQHVQQEALLLATQMHHLQHQLQENSDLLKSKMPAKGGSLQPRPLAAASPQCPAEPSAPLQEPFHSTPLQLQHHRAQDLETHLAANQQNFKDKEDMSVEMEEHLKGAVRELSWVVREKEGLSSSLRDPFHLADEAVVSPERAVSVNDAEAGLFKQEKRPCVEESQEHPLKEVCELPQDLKWEPGLGVPEVKQDCGNIVDGAYRKAGGPAGASPLRGLRDREPQSLSGAHAHLNDPLQELDLHPNGSCATPESHMAAFQKEGEETEWLEEDMLEDLKRKFSPAEKHLDKAWDSKGDEQNGDEEMQKLSSRDQGWNGELLRESEKSRDLPLEDVGEVPSCEPERASRGAFGAQKAELDRLCGRVGLQGEPFCHELEYQDVPKRFSLESEEEKPSLKFDMSEEDETIEVGPLAGEASVEGLMVEVPGDLMEKYLVCSEQDHLSASETPEYFDIETAFQSKSERGNLGFVTDELIIGLDEKMDSSVLSEGLLADPVTDLQYGSGFSHGDLRELMDKDKVYLGERCGKFNQLCIKKETALKNFSQEDEKAEETWWEGGHSLPIELNQDEESSFSCSEIVPQLEEEAENPMAAAAAAGRVPDSQGPSSASVQDLLWPGMVEICPEEVERGAGKRTSDSAHLEALHTQEGDRLQGLPDAHQGRSQRAAGRLGQKTTLEEALLQEVETLKAEIATKESLFTQIVKEKNNLEKMFSKDRENLEENILELTEKIKCLEKEQRREKTAFVGQSKLAPSEGQKPDAEIKAKDSDITQAENNLIPPMTSLKSALADPTWRLQEEAQRAAWALEDVWSELSSRFDKQMTQLKHQQEVERAQLKREHQKEVEAISDQMKEELGKQQRKWDEERKEQIGMIKQIHERERDREVAELVCKHQEELKQLREGLQSKHQQAMKELQKHLEAFHETEMQQAQLQAQTLHSLELEALRLSLSNMHTAQLELTQANLRKEKETALVELREMLNDKRAQEVALVQSRQQFELEHIKEQHRKEKEEMALEHQQELAALEKKLELEVEAHSQTLEMLKGDWDSEKGSCLRRLEEELAQKHRAEMESVREALRAQLAEQKAELEKMAHDKAQAEAALSSLQAQHQAAMQDLREELQLQRDRYLEDMDLKVREKQQELDTLQASYEELQAQSREEIQQLWSQLDSTRANRQELNDLREQLLARASHVEQLEHLKHDFEQRQQQRRSEHERELEQLRLYFEQKLRDAEDSYREDLHLLHQRLQEVREDSFLDSADVSWSIELVEDAVDVERKAHLEQLMLQLEQHKEGIAHLKLQLEEKHKEELDALKAALETHHKQQSVAEMQREKRQHDLDLEELRTRLTEEHSKEMIKVRLQCAQDAARQVEAEVAQRLLLALEDDHKARVAELQSQEGRVFQLTEEVGLARKENAELQEKLQREVALKEEAEKKRCRLVEDHQEEIKKLREEIQQLIQRNKDKEDEWQVQRGDLSRKAEERLAALALELNGKAEQEQQALREAAELRVEEMERLRDRQAADITRLEQSLRQEEESRAQEEAAWQERAAQDLEAAKAQMAKELEAATQSLRENCALELQTSQARFLEEQKEMTQKFTEKQDALFRELQEKHAGELQLQRQQTESLTAELHSQHRGEMDALRASLQSQHQAQLDARVAELQTQHRGEMDALRTSLQSQHQAQLDAQVAKLQTQHQEKMDALRTSLHSQHQTQLEARVAELQTQYQEKMDALRTSLQSQHQTQLEARVAELQTQHRGEMDALRTSLQSQHQAQLEARVAELQTQHRGEMDALRTSLHSQHQTQLEARVAELQTQYQEKMDALRTSLQSQHQTQLEARVAELQTQHRGEMDALRTSLQSQHQAQLEARVAELQTQHRGEMDTLRTFLQSQHRAQLEARVADLQTQHVAEMSDLEAKHLSNLDSLESGYLSEIQTMQEEHSHALEGLRVRLEEQLQAKEAEHKAWLAKDTEKHQRELQQAQESLRIEMTTNHIEKLKSLATELQDMHQEELQVALHNQRCLLEEENHKALDRLGEEALRMEEQHRRALQELKDIHVAELEKQRATAGQQLQEELGRLRAQHQREREEDARAASAKGEAARQQQELLFQQEMALLKAQAQVLEQQVAQLKDKLETEKRAAKEQAEELVALEREKEALTSQLQEQSGLILQLKEKVSSLNNEVAESHRELENLQARREREHEEETNLLSLLQSDMSHTRQERKTLQETNQHLLSLFGDTLKAAIAIKNQISKRIGICLDEDSLGRESTIMGRQEQPTQDTCQLPADASLRGPIPPLEFDQTLPECDETLLTETDVSCHVRESFFLSPGVTMECEQPIRRIYQSLGVAVDNLLEMMLDSNKQLEETRELHARFEKEFNRKNEETALAVRQQQELMDRLNQESAAKNQLALELHKAEGLTEGYKAEKAALEEILLQKEKSEHRLAVELENLKAQFQALIQEQAKLKEEQSLLLRQKEKLVVEAEEKAAGLLQEVEHLVKEQSETKQQSEKDCSTLRSQMRALELELEEQLSHSQELVQQAAEIQDLKEQIASLDKHLRNQRQFMDEQAIEREHERDEFQQEIRKLEQQLEQQPAKSQPWGEPRNSQSFELTPEIESLQRQLREKIDELNELVIKKELTERELSAQKGEIRNLEDANDVIRRKVKWLEDELEKQKKIGKELKQDREALQEQQMNNLLQISTLQSKLDEAKHLTPAQGSPNGEDLKEQLEAEQAALLLKEKEVLSLEEELEQLKNNLTSKNNEILQLNLELALQSSQFNANIQELSAENADLKAFLQNREQEVVSLNEQIKGKQHEVEHTVELKVMDDRSSEIEELKVVIENLRENQERLRKEKLEEAEQLHEVIEKLQQELSLLGPVVHEVSDSQGDSDSSQPENLQRELRKGLFSFRAAAPDEGAREPDPHVEQLRDALREKESQCRLRVEALERDLQSVRAASTERLDLLSHQLSLKEAEAKRAASQARHWQAAFLEKEAEADALAQERGAFLAELRVLASACSRLERDLEGRRVWGSGEPPELQMLRTQCVGLDLKLQALTRKLVTYQVALDQHQACGPQCQVQIQNDLKGADTLGPPGARAPGWPLSGAHAREAHRSDRVAQGAGAEEARGQAARPGQLAAATQGQCGDGWIQQQPMEGDQLHRGDLMTQVRHILEKLHHLIKSISSADRDADGGKQPHSPGQLERAARASPSQRPHGRVSRTSRGQSATDSGSPVSPGPECSSVCQLWDSADDTNGYAPPGRGRRQFQFDQSPDSFPSSRSGDPDYAEPLTPESSYFEERVAASNVPAQMKSRGSPPPDAGKRSGEPSQGSAQGSPSWAGSSENGSQVDTDALETVEHFRDTILDTDASSLGSPELVRRDSTLESLPSLHLTPLSHTAGLQSPEAAWRSLALPDSSGYLGLPALPGLAASPPACKDKSQPDAGQDLKRRILEKDVENVILTPKDLQEGRQSKTPGSGGDGLGHDISRISDFPDKLKQDSYRSGPPPSRPVAHLHRAQKSGMVQRPFKPMKDKLEMQSKQMKALLKMVCDESQQILVLSEAEASVPDQGSDRLRTPPDFFQKERQGLLEAVQALKEHLTLVSSRAGDKEPSDPVFDWGEFLQAVQIVLEKERNVLKIELQSKLCNLEAGDERSLLEKLEDVVKEQGELQKRTLENLHLSDRSSLLSEIQALRAQLRMTHLQNQEKLQQLYEALTNVEDHGSKQEYQFRRQIELLEYKVEQEKGLVGDLQKALTAEQEKGIEAQKLLLAAQSAAQGLAAQLEECRRDKEAISQSLRDAHKDGAHLRSALDCREKELASALEGLQVEKQKAAELQALLEEERRQSVQRDELRSKAIEELQASLEQQRSQNGQLVVSLQHEQAEKDNLKKELQIEYSRCEALLCQERGQVGELQRSLEAERARSAELGEALNHERLVTEQLSKRAGEVSSQKEAQLQHAFVRKLKEEKARGAELQALLDEARRQGLAAQKQFELEVQMHCEEMKKEKEVSGRLQASADALQKQKQELLCYVDEERAKQGRLQAELEQLQSRLKDEAGKEARRDKERRHEVQAEEEKGKRGKKEKERLGWQRELELQRQRDEHKIQQLQQTITELEKDKGFVVSRTWPEGGMAAALPPDAEKLQEHQEPLENVRQQLLYALGILTSFMNQAVNRTISDWTSSNEKAVTSLLLTLEELKSELMPSLPQKKSTQAQISLIDVLLKENGSLTKALSTMTQEKVELCRTVSKLEKTLKHHLQKGCGHIYKYVDRIGTLQKADKAAWKQQKMALQGSRHGEAGMVKAAFKGESTHGGSTCRIRMEKLYLHFLRAERFRKALIYQKRYLLLLIGGFQDSEQETLSMIAHLGVFPSKMDKRAFPSRPFTKFRTAVRVVIAILRLRFLVKKWQELDRRATFVQSGELDSVPEEAVEISRQQPPLSSSPSLPDTTSSPPTQDLPLSSLKGRRSPSPACRMWDRSLTSPSSSADAYDSSQDPEHSLTEYIHHLEVIQQRLGGVQPGRSHPGTRSRQAGKGPPAPKHVKGEPGPGGARRPAGACLAGAKGAGLATTVSAAALGGGDGVLAGADGRELPGAGTWTRAERAGGRLAMPAALSSPPSRIESHQAQWPLGWSKVDPRTDGEGVGGCHSGRVASTPEC